MRDMMGKRDFAGVRALGFAALAGVLLAATPAEAKKKKQQEAPPPAPVVQVVPLPSSPNGQTVRYFYERRQYAPIWFRAGAGDEAIGQLLSILRRAPIDGMANGPQVAASVEAAVASAKSGDPLAIKAAELALSAAWVDYVQTLRRPGKDVLYGDAYAKQVPHPDRTMAQAQAAPSLAQHLQSVSSVNAIYAQLREAAILDAQAKGGQASSKLMLNLDRARILPGTGKFILVNAADQRLYMYENGQVVDSMKVVVGMPELPTPMVASTMYYAVMNPYWHVPPHLIRKMLPNILKGPEAYMKKNGYEVISDFSGNPTIIPTSSVDWKAVAAGTQKVNMRQQPNGINSMGKMKFLFANPEGIYLHDTPKKEYFALANRAKSNGCIRVEDYRKLAYWLFGRDVAASTSEPEQHVALPRGVPVYVTYLTLQPGANGMVEIADRYGWDSGKSFVGIGSSGREAASGGGAGAGSAPQ